MFPVGRVPEVLRRWRDWADAAPGELSTGCAVILAPPEEFVPPELRGQPVLGIPVLYVGAPEAGAAAVQPLRDLGPAVDHIGPMPYTAFQAVLDPLAPWDLGGFYARGEYLPELSDAAIDVFLAHAADLVTLSPPFSQMIIFRIGQGVAGVPGDATAFSHRDANYLFHPISAWLDPADAERMIAATRAFAAAMQPFAPAPRTSISPTRPAVSAMPTATPRTPAWWPSRTHTTRLTCSGSTRTSGPAAWPANQ
jgi:hypothetical protein